MMEEEEENEVEISVVLSDENGDLARSDFQEFETELTIELIVMRGRKRTKKGFLCSVENGKPVLKEV